MSAEKKQRRSVSFRVGERVGVRLAGRVLPAVIVEDRGDLGPAGSRLVRVELHRTNDSEREREQFEVPAHALTHG